MSTDSTASIDSAAAEWLMRRDSGRWSEADQAHFERWLNASTLNRVAYMRLELGWEEAQRLSALGAGVPGDDPPPRGQWNLTPFFGAGGVEQKSRNIVGAVWKVSALAASVLVAAVLVWQWRPAGRAYETPVGGISSVPMSDGSKVTLNTDSEIRVDLNRAARRIELKHGEVFFEVAKDPHRPFIVSAGNRRVIAVGTQFSVRRDGDDLRVVVTEGKVRIEHADPAPRGGKTGVADEVLLGAGSIARATGAGIVVQNRPLPEAEEQLGWRSGVLMFRNQTLSEAIAEFNRYNERKIVIADAAVASLKIEGNFRSTNVDAFARLLSEAYPVQVERRGSDTVLLKAR